MQWKNGYFYNEDGSRYIPMGMFGCYFRGEYIGEESDVDRYIDEKVLTDLLASEYPELENQTTGPDPCLHLFVLILVKSCKYIILTFFSH